MRHIGTMKQVPHVSPTFRPKDSRFGMARLANAGLPDHSPMTVVPAIDSTPAEAVLPMVRKFANSDSGPVMRSPSIPPFGRLLGADILEADPSCVRARLVVRRDLCRFGGPMDTGAILAFADVVSSIGFSLGQAERGAQRLIETKTHFFEQAEEGTIITAEATPVHAGQGTCTWQTRITTGGERQIAFVLHTYLRAGA